MTAKSSSESAYIIEFGNHGNRQNCIKVDFDTYREGGNRNIGFWKTIKENWGFYGNKIIQSP